MYLLLSVKTHDTKSKITSSSSLALRYWSVVALMIKYYHPIPFLICSVTMQTTTVTQNQCSHVEGRFPLGYQGYLSQIGRAVEITFGDCVTDWCSRELFILIRISKDGIGYKNSVPKTIILLMREMTPFMGINQLMFSQFCLFWVTVADSEILRWEQQTS